MSAIDPLFRILERHAHRHPKGDAELFDKALNGINPFCGPAKFGSGPHCVKSFREFMSFVPRGTNILEIGFNSGAGSAIMLELGAHKVTSVELTDTSDVRNSEKIIKETHGADRFELIISDSALVEPKIEGRVFKAAFIDGDHSFDATMRDLCLAKKHGAEVVLMDDWLPQFGTSLEVLDAAGLIIQRITGNFIIATV